MPSQNAMPYLQNKHIQVVDWGLLPFEQAWQQQRSVLQGIVDVKVANRERSETNQQPTENVLVLCQHPHVFTLGKSGDASNILLSDADRETKQIAYFPIDRGGDITYHGPGQLVAYPIFDLENFFTDIGRFLRTLEEAVIRTLAFYGIQAGRIDGLTGVWVDVGAANPRKICAMGIKCSRWVSMHGLALNVNTDLQYFDYIIPCGIADRDKGVTSLAAELGHAVPMAQVQDQLVAQLMHCFEATAQPVR